MRWTAAASAGIVLWLSACASSPPATTSPADTPVDVELPAPESAVASAPDGPREETRPADPRTAAERERDADRAADQAKLRELQKLLDEAAATAVLSGVAPGASNPLVGPTGPLVLGSGAISPGSGGGGLSGIGTGGGGASGVGVTGAGAPSTPPGPKGSAAITLDRDNSHASNAAAVVAGMAAGFRRCYNRGLAADPTVRGKLTVTVALGPNGEVMSAVPSKSAVGSNVTTCVVSRITAAQFAPPAAKLSTLVLSVRFEPVPPSSP